MVVLSIHKEVRKERMRINCHIPNIPNNVFFSATFQNDPNECCLNLAYFADALESLVINQMPNKLVQ